MTDMADNTELISKVEAILLDRVVLVGDQQTTYKGYPAEMMKELAELITSAVTEGRIDELEHIEGDGVIYSTKLGTPTYLDERIKQLTAAQKGGRG